MNVAWKKYLMGLHGCGHTAHEEIVLRNNLSIALGARAVCLSVLPHRAACS